MKKRVFSIILTLLFIISASLTVCAEYIHGFFRYTVEDESVTITAYRGNEENVTVPAMIGGNPVNVIASGAFADNKNVKTVHLPDTIMTVENGAFGPDQKVFYASSNVKGDLNDDGEANNKDVVILFRYVSSLKVVYDSKYDFNTDGQLNNKDVVSLFKFVS